MMIGKIGWCYMLIKPQEVVDDVCGVGKSIGLKVNEVSANMLSVLSRENGDGNKKGGVCNTIRPQLYLLNRRIYLIKWMLPMLNISPFDKTKKIISLATE